MKRLLTGALALLLPLAAFATTLNPVGLLNPTGSTSGQAIVSTGPSTAPAWGGIGLNGIAPIASNTVLANAAAFSAAPTAFAMPLCNAVGFALGWNNSAGFTCVSGFAPAASPTFTGVPVAPTAAVSTNTTQIATTAFVNGQFGTPPALGSTTPNSAAVTTLIATGAITPSQTAGIVGTTTNNSANAGSVGEFVSSNVPSGSAVALTSNASANVTSISLTAGDWDVWGSVGIVTGGSTVVAGEQAAISTTSATLPTFPGGGGQYFFPLTLPTGQGMLAPLGTTRLSLASTTTVFLVAQFNFATSTCSAYGFIGARRRR